jgi:hypothetical protein
MALATRFSAPELISELDRDFLKGRFRRVCEAQQLLPE